MPMKIEDVKTSSKAVITGMKITKWEVTLHGDFREELEWLKIELKEELAAFAVRLEKLGPSIDYPELDILDGSKYQNIKEFRFDAENGTWHVVYAFDLEQQTILLIAGDKSDNSEECFYRQLINKVDERYDRHLDWLAQKKTMKGE